MSALTDAIEGHGDLSYFQSPGMRTMQDRSSVPWVHLTGVANGSTGNISHYVRQTERHTQASPEWCGEGRAQDWRKLRTVRRESAKYWRHRIWEVEGRGGISDNCPLAGSGHVGSSASGRQGKVWRQEYTASAGTKVA